MEGNFSNPGYFSIDIFEEGRREIIKWSEKRRSRRTGVHGTLYKITKLFITRSLVRSFMHNLSVVVAFQMILAAICTYSCVKLGLEMDVHMSLFVSPIVFPLAFSINANYQRRESVLEDLAMFKSSSSILFFCHRDWIKAAELPIDLLKTLSNKLKFLVINIREYLLTEDVEKRKYILQAIYEDLSDIAQLNDKIRTSRMKSSSPLCARIIHCHNLMCWSFERLRVIREYNSPRSLRAFTKVFIFLMPLLLSPYYVFSGRQTKSSWTPYFISVMVSFLFGSLQSVQDKLDDPFDGIGEDDVKLGQLDDWTTQSLLTNRTVTVGRFTVTTTTAQAEQSRNTSPVPPVDQHDEPGTPKRTRHASLIDVGSPKGLRRILSRKSERRIGRRPTSVGLGESEFTDQLEARCHGIASKLEGLSGTSIILPGKRTPYVPYEYQGSKPIEEETQETFRPGEDHLFDPVNGNAGSEIKKESDFHGDGLLAVVREREEEVSDTTSTSDISPVSEKLISMKSDAVVRPDDSKEKRPTILGLFSAPEENLQSQVRDHISVIPEESSDTEEDSSRKVEILSAKTVVLGTSPSKKQSVFLDNAPASQIEAESGPGTLQTSSSTREVEETAEATTSEDGSSEARKDDATTEKDVLPRLRFCLPGKHAARSEKGKLWGRKHKKKRPPKGEGKADIELQGTTSMSPLLPLHSSDMEENADVSKPLVSTDESDTDQVFADTGSGAMDYDKEDLEYAKHGGPPKDEQLIDSNSTPVPRVDEDDPTDDPTVAVGEDEWDFDVSSDKPSIKGGGQSATRTEDVTSSGNQSQPSSGTLLDTAGPRPSIMDISSSENKLISPEPGGSRFSVSRKADDSENTKASKPRSSRFTVSSS
ncbi:uncharacterized protein LOC114533877 [Dendronephthya gigantea]|uniref:uncharacterized protein LOC114533877 n=1 Tax=Dendronephthya gigantea TaxID=151771 RepID=UPI00106BF2BD|nr:uncharacterized protein LOC114533877 [Dendronephthya gigantea]